MVWYSHFFKNGDVVCGDVGAGKLVDEMSVLKDKVILPGL